MASSIPIRGEVKRRHERAIARFILAAARGAGVAIGTDGYWIDVIPPPGLQPKLLKKLQREFSDAVGKNYDAVLAVIMEEGTPGPHPFSGASPPSRRAP